MKQISLDTSLDANILSAPALDKDLAFIMLPLPS